MNLPHIYNDGNKEVIQLLIEIKKLQSKHNYEFSEQENQVEEICFVASLLRNVKNQFIEYEKNRTAKTRKHTNQGRPF